MLFSSSFLPDFVVQKTMSPIDLSALTFIFIKGSIKAKTSILFWFFYSMCNYFNWPAGGGVFLGLAGPLFNPLLSASRWHLSVNVCLFWLLKSRRRNKNVSLDFKMPKYHLRGVIKQSGWNTKSDLNTSLIEASSCWQIIFSIWLFLLSGEVLVNHHSECCSCWSTRTLVLDSLSYSFPDRTNAFTTRCQL